jgi:TetR/AcrR family transcriptional regulator, transcriptional repressor for nem operon
MARTKDFDENEVLCKAIQLFWRKGYNATSMQELVDALGISRSSLYDTYTDKHTLFIKALESYQTTGYAQIERIIEEGLPARDTVKKLLELATGSLSTDDQQKGCFMVNAEIEVAPHDQDVNKMVCQNDQQMEDAFYRVIRAGQESGELKNKQDARLLARFIFNAVKGMRVTAKSNSDPSFFNDMIKLTVATLD